MPAVTVRAAMFAAAAVIPVLMPSTARAQAPVPTPAAQAGEAPLDPSAPLAPMPDLGVAWPDLSTPDAPGPADGAQKTPAGADADLTRRYHVVLTGIDELGPSFRAQFHALSALDAGANAAANAAQIGRRLAQDEDLLRQLLRSVGRYDGTVDGRVDTSVTPVTVTLAVTPGRAYHFAAVDLPGIDAAGDRAAALTQAFGVKVGDTVDADRVNTAVLAYRARLGHDGFPFAKVADPEVTVDHADGEARLTLSVTLGAPARFGKIVSTGKRPVFSASHIADIARFHPGQPYDAARLDDLRRALIQTSLVSVATVTPVESGTPGVVDIAVQTERAPPRTVAGELGYGTGEGARAEVSWQHRNLLPPEGAITFRGIAGTREQLLSATLRRSNFHARDRILNAQIAASHSNLNAYDARTFSISANLERQTNIIWQKKWVWSFGSELLASDERDTIKATGEPRRRTFVVAALPGTLAYDSSDDLLNPTRGFRLAGRLSPEASLHKHFDGYVKAQVDASAYWPVTSSVVLAGRLRFASISGASTETIAPSRRLYSGGGGSVRGYGYQKIGPVDVDGDPVGGRGLAEFGTEARFRFGSFGIVPFFDGGNLSDRPYPSFKTMRYGAGLGARYYTSFGPIRVDLGTPIARRRGESRLAIYVSLGQAF